MRELPRGTVTFLFSDIEGSTRLLQELGEGYAGALAEHRLLLRGACRSHGGREVDTQGDALFVAFARATDALAAAAEGQQALGAGPVRVRMGIHTGEPIVTEEGYVGLDVHRAARIAAAGHGGQILVSQSTRELVGAHDLRDLGEHRLKDLTQPERLYQLGDGDFPPLKGLNQTNLPVQPTLLVGRRRELDEILALLHDGVRLLTLTGAGGSGKTRLALQAAAELIEDYRDGVWFVPLASVNDTSLVLPAVATTLGAKDGLVEHLRSRRTLLLLDNFEQVVEAGPRLAELLRAAPQLAVLATSRERLALAGEHEYVVPTLPLADAVALFTARARQLNPTFEPVEQVSEICRRLEGLPLALELAAARVKVLTPEQILARLERRLDLLAGGARDLPERQRTLRKTIEWSYDLLDGEQRLLFARVGVYAGSFDLEAAEEMSDADLDALQSLVDKSMLRHTEAGRFFLLEMIREYALERLEQTGESESIRRRHSDYFLGLAERAAAELKGPDQTAWLSRLDSEHDNFRAALRWLGEAGEAQLKLRLTIALARFWYVRGHFDEARKWLDEVLAAEEMPAASVQPAALRAQALTAASAVALIQGDYDEAIELSEQTLLLARAQQDRGRIANALSNLGAIVLGAGDPERAAPLLEEAVILSRELEEKPVAARALNNLGDLALTVGDYAQAEALFEESLDLLRELGDTSNVARSLFNLGATALRRGRYPDALSRFRESIALSRGIDDKEDLAWCLEGFAALAAAEGDPERATRLLGAAGVLLETIGGAFKPFERLLHDHTVAAAQTQLGATTFEAIRAEGAALNLQQAVEYAVEAAEQL